MFTSLKKLISPKFFYRMAGLLLPWLIGIDLLLFGYGILGALWLAPADFQQGDGFRIIYVHVPAAVLSLGIYVVMAGAAAIFLVWKIKLADIVAKVSAPLGAAFTLIALITGSLWGKPMWGTWWVWDARLTSELILFFLYCGYSVLRASFEDDVLAAKASGILALVGVVDIPIIHYSVNWWNTLHQKASLFQLAKPTIAPSMLIPLLVMLVAFWIFYLVLLLIRMRSELIAREYKTEWMRTLLEEKKNAC